MNNSISSSTADYILMIAPHFSSNSVALLSITVIPILIPTVPPLPSHQIHHNTHHIIDVVLWAALELLLQEINYVT